MISSFTLWSSRTTSSRISCWAEPQSEGTDTGSRGLCCRGLSLSQALGKLCSHHPSVHDGCPQGGAPEAGHRCPGTPSFSTGQAPAFVAVKHGTHWLDIVPRLLAGLALTCFIRSKSKASRPTSFTLPAGFTLKEEWAGVGTQLPGSVGTHAGVRALVSGLKGHLLPSPSAVFNLRLLRKDESPTPQRVPQSLNHISQSNLGAVFWLERPMHKGQLRQLAPAPLPPRDRQN